jgi:DNA repair photolyase
MKRTLPILRGRGAGGDLPNRFERLSVQLDPEEARAAPHERDTQYLRDPARSVLTRNRSPDVGFDWSLNPYRGCEHGCVYCLAPDTPILYADTSWRPIGDVSLGDELIGFDEYPEPGRTRKLRPSVVQRIWWSRKPTLRMVTDHTEVITTAEHRWLQAGASGWSRTDELRAGLNLRSLETSQLDRGDDARKRDSLFHRTPPTSVEEIRAIEPGATMDVVDIQTSTGTFYAAGLATHNCYARPTHEYLGFSAGLDFESRILVKEQAPELLEREIAKPSWTPTTLVMSGVTDPYQPVERKVEVTRRCLEVLARARHPVALITKSRLVERDADLLAELARHDAAHVTLSITTLDRGIQRALEPRASPPEHRLAALRTLAGAGVPVAVNVAPVIPGLTEHEIPAIIEAAAEAGATGAGYVVLRLPGAVEPLFLAWLQEHAPDRVGKVMSRLRSLRGGALYDATFGTRMSGEGPFAQQIADLFDVARARAGMPRRRLALSTAAFERPAAPREAGARPEDQLDLF